MTPLLLTVFWNYSTRNVQMDHAIPQYIALNKTNFEYKLYKLRGLIGVAD